MRVPFPYIRFLKKIFPAKTLLQSLRKKQITQMWVSKDHKIKVLTTFVSYLINSNHLLYWDSSIVISVF